MGASLTLGTSADIGVKSDPYPLNSPPGTDNLHTSPPRNLKRSWTSNEDCKIMFELRVLLDPLMDNAQLDDSNVFKGPSCGGIFISTPPILCYILGCGYEPYNVAAHVRPVKSRTCSWCTLVRIHTTSPPTKHCHCAQPVGPKRMTRTCPSVNMGVKG